jgi:hypothetical protein
MYLIFTDPNLMCTQALVKQVGTAIKLMLDLVPQLVIRFHLI